MIFKQRPDLSVNDENIEALCVEIINKKIRITLANTQHRQPAGEIKQNEKYLKNFFKKTIKADQPIYIQGKLNLNLLDY